MTENLSVEQDKTVDLTASADNAAGIPAEDFDDVEGHGLREIAAGVGTAAIVVGGAATFASQAGHTDAVPPRPQIPTVVTQLAGDATTIAHDAAGGATGMANDATAGALAIVDPTIATVANKVNSTLATVKGDVSATTQWADGVESYATTTVHNVTAPAVRTVADTTHNLTSYAGQTVGSADTLANQTVKGAIGTTLHVTATAKSLINNAGWNLGVSVLGTHVGSGGTVLDPTGLVTITDASGKTVASMNLADGTCTITLATGVANGTLTMHYLGDLNYAPSSLLISPLLG